MLVCFMHAYTHWHIHIHKHMHTTSFVLFLSLSRSPDVAIIHPEPVDLNKHQLNLETCVWSSWNCNFLSLFLNIRWSFCLLFNAVKLQLEVKGLSWDGELKMKHIWQSKSSTNLSDRWDSARRTRRRVKSVERANPCSAYVHNTRALTKICAAWRSSYGKS